MSGTAPDNEAGSCAWEETAVAIARGDASAGADAAVDAGVVAGVVAGMDADADVDTDADDDTDVAPLAGAAAPEATAAAR
ncbi:hypothetical protein, partial [Burkholderia pseudomallei]|uniref:hypothetical protein n=1 Tax=Burkholderia pseudomallei TaxID=28450 RepID=UPI00016AFF3F